MSATRVLEVRANHPLNRVGESLKRKIVAAQQNLLEMTFANAAELCGQALADLKVAIVPPTALADRQPTDLGDLPAKDLMAFFTELLLSNGIPEQGVSLHAANLTGCPVIRRSRKLMLHQEVRTTRRRRSMPRCESPTPPTSPTSRGTSSSR